MSEWKYGTPVPAFEVPPEVHASASRFEDELREIWINRQWYVEFHEGDDYDDVTYTLTFTKKDTGQSGIIRHRRDRG